MAESFMDHLFCKTLYRAFFVILDVCYIYIRSLKTTSSPHVDAFKNAFKNEYSNYKLSHQVCDN
jgi:hypothetical protein